MKSSTDKKEYRIGKLLSISLEVFKKNILSIMILTIVCFIPLIIALMPIIDSGLDKASKIILVLILLLINFLASIAIIYITNETVQKKRKLDLKKALKKSIPKLLPTLATLILVYLVIVILLAAMMFLAPFMGLGLLLLLPIIYFIVRWYFSIHAVVLKGKYTKEALDYSGKVVGARGAKVFLIVLLNYVGIFGTRGLIIPEYPILGAVIGGIVVAFFSVVNTVFFLNLDSYRRRG